MILKVMLVGGPLDGETRVALPQTTELIGETLVPAAALGDPVTIPWQRRRRLVYQRDWVFPPVYPVRFKFAGYRME